MTTNPIPETSFILNDSNQMVITRKIAEGGMGTVYEARQIGVEGFEKNVFSQRRIYLWQKPVFMAGKQSYPVPN